MFSLRVLGLVLCVLLAGTSVPDPAAARTDFEISIRNHGKPHHGRSYHHSYRPPPREHWVPGRWEWSHGWVWRPGYWAADHWGPPPGHWRGKHHDDCDDHRRHRRH